MKRTTTRILATLVAVTLTAFATQHVIKAYVIKARWSSNSATYVYSFYLPNEFKSGTDRGAYRWTKVKRSSWTWIKDARSPNWIHYGSIDGPGNAVGVTRICGPMSSCPPRAGEPIAYFWIKYDSSENWYTGTDIPASHQVDLESVATHEFGHALGLGHTQSIYCAGSYSTWATMCPSALLGTAAKRSLEDDDKNGVSALYPP